MFLKLFKLGPRGAGAIPDGLLVEVTPKHIERFIGDLAPLRETPIIPDKEARAIGNAAIDFMKYAKPICIIYECANAYLDSTSYNSRHNKRAAILAREQFVYAYARRHEVEEALRELKPLLAAANKFHAVTVSDYRHCRMGELLAFMSFNVISHSMQHLTASCFINVALLNGFRSSEITSIGPGDIRAAGVGTIIRTQIHMTSGRTQGVAVDRPGHISMLQVDEILSMIASAQNTGRYWALGRGGSLMNLVLSKVLNEFCFEIVGVTNWNFTSRQFRRYFAIFYVMRFNGPEDALRRAFRHVTASALKSYVKDEQNARYLIEAKRSLVRAIYLGIATADGQFGAPDSSPTVQKLKRYAASNLPLEEIEKEVGRKVDESPAEIRPTVWGYCMLNKNDPLGALCGSDSGTPQALEMYPGNCGRCQHLVVSRDHVPFWESSRSMHEDVLRCPSSLKRLKEASATGLRIADNVIARLTTL